MMYRYKGVSPKLADDVFVAPGAVILGDVEIGAGSNIWFYTVIRGDVHSVKIGPHANIQDHCMLHVTGGRYPLFIGERLIAGHRAVLHGCTIGDNVLIGIGALVLDGAVIGSDSIVAAGAVVSPGTVIPPNRVAMGIPARPTREPTDEERSWHIENNRNYEEYGRTFHQLVEPLVP